MDKAYMFLFVAMVVMALFTFLSVGAWAGGRVEERKTAERYALFRKLAEQPSDTARLVLEMVREEEAKNEEKERRRKLRSRRDALLTGSILIATGVGLSVMVGVLSRKGASALVGLIPILIGLVVSLFAWFGGMENGS